MHKKLAIEFAFNEQFTGNDFFGRVSVQGRGLLESCEDSGWIFHGIVPGGVGGVGRTELEAFADFREAFRSVLYDFAAEAEDAAHFREMVEGFKATPSLSDLWEEARGALRDALKAGKAPEASEMPVTTKPKRACLDFTVLERDKATGDSNDPATPPRLVAA